MEALQRAIKNQNMSLALKILDENKKNEEKEKKLSFKSDLEHYYCKNENSKEKTDDNILHFAVTHLDEKHRPVIEELVRQCPELLEKAKGNKHQGQTPLHILIVRKHNDTLQEIRRLLLDATIGDNIRHNIFNTKVQGTLFRKTSMEGELPYIVAVLTLDIETAKVVIEMTDDQAKKIKSEGGNADEKIAAQNSRGDTAYHCLVKHAARHPEDIQKVIAMWDFLTSFAKNCNENRQIENALLPDNVFHLTNKEGMRPLQLAAHFGLPKLFSMILNSEKIPNKDDRLFDSNLFDISVIDTVSHFLLQRKQEEETRRIKSTQVGPMNQSNSNNFNSTATPSTKKLEVGQKVKKVKSQYSQSVLEMMCNRSVARDKNSVFEIIRQPPMKKLITKKWKSNRKWFFIWLALHISIMILYSFNAMQWSIVAFPTNTTNPGTEDLPVTFVYGSSCFLIGVGIVYLFISGLLIVTRFVRPNALQYATHDLEYLILMLVFSVCLVIDKVWYFISVEHDANAIIISLLCGWWFSIFFCRAFESISYYVAMIQRVIFGDLLRFGLFLVLALVSFSIAFQILFQGTGVPTTYDSDANREISLSVYGRTVFLNIRLMFGLGDIEVIGQARDPAMAYAVYLVYVTMTYLILLNSLIAMISETCAAVRQNESAFYRTQQLSVILFLEDIFYLSWYKFPPTSPFGLREVKRNGVTEIKYFLKMTDKNPGDQFEEKASPTAYHSTVKSTEPLTINITQPFYEERLDAESKQVTKLIRWNDRENTEINLTDLAMENSHR
ncbi:transient receptor potential cation channel subfamily V member 4-like isoform X2 [Argopecten irradians]